MWNSLPNNSKNELICFAVARFIVHEISIAVGEENNLIIMLSDNLSFALNGQTNFS